MANSEEIKAVVPEVRLEKWESETALLTAVTAAVGPVFSELYLRGGEPQLTIIHRTNNQLDIFITIILEAVCDVPQLNKFMNLAELFHCQMEVRGVSNSDLEFVYYGFESVTKAINDLEQKSSGEENPEAGSADSTPVEEVEEREKEVDAYDEKEVDDPGDSQEQS